VARALDEQSLLEIPGVVPPLDRLPEGCAFADRCARARDVCRVKQPELIDVAPNHRAACLFAVEHAAETVAS
jgi:oligopeptide/dipeptide ABC transporter ATP-binding protein